MDQKDSHDKNPDDEANEYRDNDRIPHAKKTKWIWDYWSGHPEPILLFFAAALFLAPITDFMSKQVKVWSIGFGIWLVCAAIICFVCKSITASMALSGRSDQKETPKFSVRLISQISSQITGIPTNFRVVYRMTDGRLVAHRVFTMLFVKFANSGTIDGQIDSYTIQGRLRYDFGEWEEINPLYVSPMGFISYAPDPKKSTSMACATPCFDDAVANKIFHPGQETMALLILPMPKGGYATQLRITLVDKGGNQSVYPLESTATAGPASAPADIPVSISMFRVLNKGVDISAIPIESP